MTKRDAIALSLGAAMCTPFLVGLAVAIPRLSSYDYSHCVIGHTTLYDKWGVAYGRNVHFRNTPECHVEQAKWDGKQRR